MIIISWQCLYIDWVCVCSTWSCYKRSLIPVTTVPSRVSFQTSLVVLTSSAKHLNGSVVLCFFVMNRLPHLWNDLQSLCILYGFLFSFFQDSIIISNLQMSGSWNIVPFLNLLTYPAIHLMQWFSMYFLYAVQDFFTLLGQFKKSLMVHLVCLTVCFITVPISTLTIRQRCAFVFIVMHVIWNSAIFKYPVSKSCSQGFSFTLDAKIGHPRAHLAVLWFSCLLAARKRACPPDYDQGMPLTSFTSP